MTPQSILTGYFPETKQEQKTFVEQLIEGTLNGFVNPLKAEAQVKNIEDVVKLYRSDKRIKDSLINCFNREFPNQKTGDAYNALFKIAETGVKYDYSVSADWREANEACQLAEEKRKVIEERLKTAHPKCPYIDISTGEEIHFLPKSSTTQVTVTIK